ncbi:MAG: hypothetical protein NWS07_01540, partial [Desulfobacterales bacterium]|nr:hypothetical protein [Desulfobacterales bacterium]
NDVEADVKARQIPDFFQVPFDHFALVIQKCAIFRKFKEIGDIARRHTAVCRTSDSARPVTSLA